jgi:hypothetical protein
MIPVETIPGLGEGGIKENDGGVNANMIYLVYYKNFCKCHNVPPAQQKNEKKEKNINLRVKLS